MRFPEPKAALVIRYSYLWARERDQGNEEGVKDRPCAVLLATQKDEGDYLVTVLPISHSRPYDEKDAVEIPSATKRRLSLDVDQSWIVLTEGNSFVWPGPDLRPVAGRGPESVALGYLPNALYEIMRDGFVELHKQRKARFVMRSD